MALLVIVRWTASRISGEVLSAYTPTRINYIYVYFGLILSFEYDSR